MILLGKARRGRGARGKRGWRSARRRGEKKKEGFLNAEKICWNEYLARRVSGPGRYDDIGRGKLRKGYARGGGEGGTPIKNPN